MEKLIAEMKSVDETKTKMLKDLEKRIDEYEEVIEELKETIHTMSQKQ